MYLCLVLAATLVSVATSQGPAAAPSPTRTPWKTSGGFKPVIISNGQSGLFPDQTQFAYRDALAKSAPGLILYCDLQLSKDAGGVCRTNIDLSSSTFIADVFPNASKTYEVNGNATTGYFSIDFTASQLFNNVTARQSQQSRSSNFDGAPLMSPEDIQAQVIDDFTNVTGLPAFLWINVEYSKFYEQHKLNMTAYLLSVMNDLAPAYISSTEVGLLRALRSRASKSKTTTVFKVPTVGAVEPTTNRTYGTILGNLTTIRTFASGILVPKDIIWPMDANLHLETPTTLVQDAHRQKLEVHAFTFAIDTTTISYNYSYDPIKEVLTFVDAPSFAVDGVLTDFPVTASMAIDCYANQDGASSSAEATDKTVLSPFTGKQVITHSGGDSGNYPGSTRLSYMSAISKGADFIDCPVQMTKDGIPVCRLSPDLLKTTNVAETALISRTKTVASVQDAPGVFSFDLAWEEISTLKAKIFSPNRDQALLRDPSNDGTQSILRLSDFLAIAKDNSKVGVYLVLEKAYLLNGTSGVDTVGAVVSGLKEAGLDNKSDVIIQSEDSSVLRSLRKLSSAKLIYNVPFSNVSLTDDVLDEIKQFADGIAVPRVLVSPFDNFITGESLVVSRVHNHSLSLLVSYFRNEFVSLAFDFLSNPTLELNTFVQYYKIDGIITDFPETAKSYLTNRCLRAPQADYQIPLIRYNSELVPPAPAGAPFPPLSIAEPPLPSLAPAPSPAADEKKSSGVSTLPGVWSAVTCLLLLHLFGAAQRQFF